MIQARNTPEKTCIGCGTVFHPRNELDHRWRDVRYCSSACQRRSSSGTHNRPVRPVRFPQGLASIDGDK